MEKIYPADRAENGPFDVSEVGLLTPYLDFTSIRVSPVANVAIRADIDESSKRIVSLTLEINGHRLQLQAFASSKSDGLWGNTMIAIEAGIKSQGGQIEKISGALGPELRVFTPVQEGNKKTMRESRFIGTDGPKWFLRGVLTGPDLNNPERYAELVSLFRGVAVSRGDQAMPPGDLLPITLPTND